MEYFDLKMLDDKYSEHNFPMLSINMTKTPKIEVLLTSYDWFTIGNSYPMKADKKVHEEKT